MASAFGSRSSMTAMSRASAVMSAIAPSRSAASGHGAPVALTAGFHTGFLVSAALVAASVVTAAGLLRDEGRGQRVNLVELQAG